MNLTKTISFCHQYLQNKRLCSLKRPHCFSDEIFIYQYFNFRVELLSQKFTQRSINTTDNRKKKTWWNEDIIHHLHGLQFIQYFFYLVSKSYMRQERSSNSNFNSGKNLTTFYSKNDVILLREEYFALCMEYACSLPLIFFSSFWLCCRSLRSSLVNALERRDTLPIFFYISNLYLKKKQTFF